MRSSAGTGQRGQGRRRVAAAKVTDYRTSASI